MLSDPEKLQIAIEALYAIVGRAHAPNCDANIPVHECGCAETDPVEIAHDALAQIEGNEPRHRDNEDGLFVRKHPTNYGGRTR
jgi:hypothetical protein